MRAIWSGTIGFGLVNIPIKLYSAVSEGRLDLDMLDKRDHSHIRFHRVNEKTGKEVPWENIVKGYLYNDEYVILEDEDFEQAAPKKSKMIEIESFVDQAEIDDIYYDTPYFIEPEKSGAKAYELLLKTLEKTGKAGIARFVLRSVEHICVLRPREDHLLLQQLRFDEDVRKPDELKLPAGASKIGKKELDMATALVEQYSASFDIAQYKNEYRDELLKIIKAKASGKKPVVKKMKIVHTASNDLLSQLKASIGGGRSSKAPASRAKTTSRKRAS